MTVEGHSQSASLLSKGDWYKVAITSSGVYQVSGEYLAQNGVDLSSINPTTLQVYGFGGGMLAQPLSSPRHEDLPEQTIQVMDGGDGNFDNTDYLLFYAESPDQYHTVERDGQLQVDYQKNLYADTAYYYITFGQRDGKRISANEFTQASQYFSSYDFYQVYEEDVNNILDIKSGNGSGREWYGEAIRSGQQVSSDFPMTGLVSEDELKLTISVMHTVTASAKFSFNLAGQDLGAIDLPALSSGQYDDKGVLATDTFTLAASQLNGETASLTVAYQSGGTGSGYLDKAMLQYQRTLALYGDQTIFRKAASVKQTVPGYNINTGNKEVGVWDITDPLNPIIQTTVKSNNMTTFGSPSSSQLHEFIVFDQAAIPAPEWRGQVSNQNIKSGSPEFVIVTYPGFLTEANRLADFRRQHNQMSVQVVTTTQVYHEFSSGRQDITAIRNYLKYLYDSHGGSLKNVLLFGRGSFDYKDRVENNTNFVPTYESRNSVNPIYSYSSDDYYGFMEDGEGYWDESYAGDHTLDIGVGRLPVKSLEEASEVVDKLIYYSSNPATYGQWKSKVVFVADDGDRNQHQRDAEELSSFVDTAYQTYNIEKVYIDAYEQESIPNGERAPLVNNALEEAIKKGAFLVNYNGHGSENQWAHETILTQRMINSWENMGQLSFFVTATCEFGRQDVPGTISGAERLVLNPEGGAIGIVTTARPVFSSTNLLINRAFYRHVFERIDGEYQTLGGIFLQTKNDGLSGRVNRNFSLIGDPSMTLSYPQDQLVIDQVLVKDENGQYYSSDTLKAFSQIKIEGSVIKYTDRLINDGFDGTLYLTVYDKATIYKTLGNGSDVMNYSERNSLIHKGKVSVTDGKFVAEFMVPKDIVYKNGEGKISMYALQSDGDLLADAQGTSEDIQIGGSLFDVPGDNKPPLIALYMDDSTFVNGGTTGSNTTLIANLNDESGINISSQSLGHGIVGELFRGQELLQTVDLNEFYSTTLDTYQQGEIVYPLQNLEDGEYMLTLHAWDNINNKATENILFIVQSGEVFVVNKFYNAPNPMSNLTTFWIDHNRQGDNLDIQILIVNSQGQQVVQLGKHLNQVPTLIRDLQWDGRDAYGNRLIPGVYLAKLLLKSLEDGSQTEKIQKIIVTN